MATTTDLLEKTPLLTTIIAPSSSPEAVPSEKRIPSKTRQWTRDEIAGQIIAGEMLLVHSEKVYKVNSWIRQHPGGEQLMLHFVGRDSTDQINISHSKEVVEKQMKPFYVGDIAESEEKPFRSLLPPSMLGFHPKYSTSKQKGKAVEWVQEGEVRAFLEGRERAAAASWTKTEEERVPLPTLPTPRKAGADLPTLVVADLYPPAPQPFTALEVQASADFRALGDIIESSGLMQAPPLLSGYSVELLRYASCLAVFLTAWWALVYGGYGADSNIKQAALVWTSAVGLGVYWHLASYTAHDIGHRSIANGSYFWNNIVGVLLSDLSGGLSIGWWCHEHNIHHHLPNDVEHDPDVQQLPFLALNKASIDSLWSTCYKEYKVFDAFAALAVSVQHMTYYILLSVGRFNLCILSYQHLAIYAHKDKMWFFEVASIFGHFYWLGGIIIRSLPSWKLRALFLVVSFITASPLHLMIVQSHYSRSMEDVGILESHMTRQLRTTMDILIHPWMRFYFGGLEHQVTHHLFPRMPRHNLRAASLIIRAWCKEKGYSYDSYGFVEGNVATLSVLKSIADQVKMMRLVVADHVDEMQKLGIAHAFTP